MVEKLIVYAFLEGAITVLKKDDPNNKDDRKQFVEAVKFAVKHFTTPELKSEVLTLVKTHNIEDICFKCGGNIQQGQALENTWVSFDDFGNDAGQPGTTMSKIGHPNMINCRKCKSCGHSFTI